MRVHRDERGLIGKLLVVWVVILVLVAVAVVDAASIVLARVRTIDLARTAASAGADAFEETGRRSRAVRAARARIRADDDDALMKDLAISEEGAVTVTVTDRAGTFLTGRIGFLDHLAEVTASSTSG